MRIPISKVKAGQIFSNDNISWKVVKVDGRKIHWHYLNCNNIIIFEPTEYYADTWNLLKPIIKNYPKEET